MSLFSRAQNLAAQLKAAETDPYPMYMNEELNIHSIIESALAEAVMASQLDTSIVEEASNLVIGI